MIDDLSAVFEVTPMQTVKLRAGDTIISEGDDGNTAFLIVSGSVQVSVGITDGLGSEVASGLKEGDVVITSVTVPNAKPAGPASNPFGGGQRRF